MPITIKVNELTLTHRGSSGTSMATVPDVCLTPAPPAPPVPIPYPNVAMSSDLVNGTMTVTADGGNMIAIQGSQFIKSTGDEPGVVGGVVSHVNMRETNWMTYSMDVFFDGRNVCRLSDKQFHNHYNTVNMAGEFEALLAANPRIAGWLQHLCAILCDCLDNPNYSPNRGRPQYQKCMDEQIQEKNRGIKAITGENSPVSAETPFTRNPATGQWTQGTGGVKGHIRKPDAIIKRDGNLPPSMDNLDTIIEVKFAKGTYKDRYSCNQQQMDGELAAQSGANVIVLSPENCGCEGGADPTIDECDEDEATAEDQAQPTPYTDGEQAQVLIFALLALFVFGGYAAARGIGGLLGGAGPTARPPLPGPGPVPPGPPPPGPPLPGPPLPGPPGGPLGPPQLPPLGPGPWAPPSGPGPVGPPGPWLPPAGGPGFAPGP